MADFSQRMIDILNYGALNLAMAIGYKNRIFDTLEALNKPCTIPEIARATELNARYLTEWLGIMVAGQVIELSQSPDNENLYYLPPSHAAFLTRNAGNNNFGVYTQEIPLLTACVIDDVNAGFKTGAGVPFSKYPDFQAFMAELGNAKHKEVLIDQFLPTVEDGKLVKRLKAGITVCDLGCGQGVALNLMAEAFPKSEFIGIDNHQEAISCAMKDAQKAGLSNVSYEILDAAIIEGMDAWRNRFDYILAFDSIHDQSHPLEALKGIRYMLAPAGSFSMVDIKAGSEHADNADHPMGSFLYTVSLMHCMPVGLNDDGTGLGMMWGKEKAVEFLSKAGFEDIRVIEMPHDSFNLHFFCKVP